MLPKNRRLTSLGARKSHYDRLIHGAFFLLKWRDSKQNLFAVQVAKNIANKAHDRNKIKRMAYKVLADMNRSQICGECLLIAKKNTNELDEQKISADILGVFDKLSKVKK